MTILQNAQAVFIDVESRTARIAAEQSYETFGFTEYYGMAAQEKFLDSGLFYIPSRKELIWLLERKSTAVYMSSTQIPAPLNMN